MNGHLIRGGLWIGLVKILHDNLQAEGTPPGSFGIGHTQLAWTRDGETWYRDQTPFFEPDPAPDAWDHAHAWMDCQVLVGDEVFIYYGGYKSGHKVNRYEERQIGLVRIPRDRYVSRDAGAEGGTLTTPPVILQGDRLTVNACVRGQMRVRLLDTEGKPIPGFDAVDCPPIQGDAVDLSVHWKGSLETITDEPVRIEFQLRDAHLYGFDLKEEPTTSSTATEQGILTPEPPVTPRLPGAKVFGVRPGRPFLFTIPATGERPMEFAVDHLPEG
jgi:hypothetical protein